MYLFGHVGLTAGGVRASGRKADLRWAALLAVAPDLLDKPAALLFPTFVNENTRGVGHSLLGALVALSALILLRRRLGPPLILWACYLGHLLLDRMWLNDNPIVLCWPFLGPFPPPMHGALNGELLKWNLWGEAAGFLVLLALAARHRLFDRARLGELLRTGRFP